MEDFAIIKTVRMHDPWIASMCTFKGCIFTSGMDRLLRLSCVVDDGNIDTRQSHIKESDYTCLITSGDGLTLYAASLGYITVI
jgi:hypothetical protein